VVARRGGAQKIPRPPTIRLGGPAPWAGLASEARRLPLDEVRRRSRAFPAPPPAPRIPGNQAAAVLVPLFEAGGETRVVLTRRPETMPSHQGEISFPGGKLHPDHDATLRDAALREAEEEIGLRPDDVDVVAELDSLATVASRFAITPFVGLIDCRPPLVANPAEVVAVIDVPISELLDDAVFREEVWWFEAADRPMFFYELPGETVWGATARILTDFLVHLTQWRRS